MHLSYESTFRHCPVCGSASNWERGLVWHVVGTDRYVHGVFGFVDGKWLAFIVKNRHAIVSDALDVLVWMAILVPLALGLLVVSRY